MTSDSPTAAAPRWKLTLLAVAVTVTLVLAGCPGTNPTLVVPAIRKHTDRGGGDRSGQTGEFSGDDPATRWTLSSDAAAVNPIPVGGTGAIVSLGTHLVRVTGSTGEEAWRVDVGNLSGSPALDGAGNVIFATTEGVVRAIDSETSRDIWQVDLEGMARTAPLPLSSTIVVGVERDLVALDPASGTTVWRTTLPARLSGSPAADEDDLVLALDDDGVLHGLDGPTGTRLFDVHLATDARRTDEDASGQPITPAVVGDLGLVVAPDGRVSGVSIPDGTVMWTTDPGGAVGSSPAADAHHVWVVTSAGRAVALDPGDGTVIWSTDLASSPTSSPVRTGGADRMILIATDDGTLNALDPDAGGTRWTVRVGDDVDDIRTDPIVADTTIIIDDGHGNVVGIR